MARVVVDADYLVYAAGFAAERRVYDVSGTHAGREYEAGPFDSKDVAEAWCLDMDSCVIIPIAEAEPLPNALHLLNKMLAGVEKAMTAAGIEFDRLELFITGKGNFRDTLATIRGYKANREASHKPVHYDELRKFLKNRWGATEVNGYEADDAVAMAAHADPTGTIVVSVDKDLLTVPGQHYNFKTKKFLTVTPRDALVNFYRQLIAGDVTDNVAGAYKAGKKAAQANISPTMDEPAMYRVTLELYKRGLGITGCPYGNMAAEDALLENARLLHMKRHPGDVWEPPGRRG